MKLLFEADVRCPQCTSEDLAHTTRYDFMCLDCGATFSLDEGTWPDPKIRPVKKADRRSSRGKNCSKPRARAGGIKKTGTEN